MNNQLTNLLVNLSPDILFLFWLRGIIISFLREMVRVFLGHEISDVLFNVVNDKLFLLD